MSARATTPRTLFPVQSTGPKPPPVGELVTFDSILDGQALADLDEAIQQADKHLTANGNKGKARIIVKLEIEAAGVIRIFGVKQKLDLPELAKHDAKVKAAHVDGQLRYIDEEAQKALDEEARKQAEENGRANAERGRAITDEVIGPRKGALAEKGEGSADG